MKTNKLTTIKIIKSVKDRLDNLKKEHDFIKTDEQAIVFLLGHYYVMERLK